MIDVIPSVADKIDKIHPVADLPGEKETLMDTQWEKIISEGETQEE